MANDSSGEGKGQDRVIGRASSVLIFLLLLGCDNPQPQLASQEPVEPRAFQVPTATEIFNLRSRCAELGAKILRENSIGSALAQNQTSHYNPKTNRCFVELDVFSADSTKPREINNFYLYDGQTGEMLVWATDERGKKAGFGFAGLPHANATPWDAAVEAISDYMADDRKQ